MATKKKKEKELKKKDIAATYNEFKDYEGRFYTGMKIGRSHKWYYDKGVWKETKVTPDLWTIEYAVVKRRAGKAPEGSGVPVGTGYHWYILAHQNVTKVDANNYTTSLTGLKYKLAHKRPGNDKWNVSDATQRKHLVGFLEKLIKDLQKEPEPIPTQETKKNGTTIKKAAKKAPSSRLKKAASKRKELVEA